MVGGGIVGVEMVRRLVEVRGSLQEVGTLYHHFTPCRAWDTSGLLWAVQTLGK